MNQISALAARLHLPIVDTCTMLGFSYETYKKWRKGVRGLPEGVVERLGVVNGRLDLLPPSVLEDRGSLIGYLLSEASHIPASPQPPTLSSFRSLPETAIFAADVSSAPPLHPSLRFRRPPFFARTRDLWDRVEQGRALYDYAKRWGRDQVGSMPGMFGGEGQWQNEIRVSCTPGLPLPGGGEALAPSVVCWAHPEILRHVIDFPPSQALKILRSEWGVVSAAWRGAVLSHQWFVDLDAGRVGGPDWFMCWQHQFALSTLWTYFEEHGAYPDGVVPLDHGSSASASSHSLGTFF